MSGMWPSQAGAARDTFDVTKIASRQVQLLNATEKGGQGGGGGRGRDTHETKKGAGAGRPGAHTCKQGAHSCVQPGGGSRRRQTLSTLMCMSPSPANQHTSCELLATQTRGQVMCNDTAFRMQQQKWLTVTTAVSL